ncbi:hypothetical protein PoB_001333800 [Plakobranchus ocellatus]|uniref:Uncharacterized protein n=1 Tax=Plakobranchus ocellatus TaxID=259542 RepID=A0AAV3YWR1_9GAST|nr:hypothetical protein PoB_001333800 [Plakobranchus ocellatus]
MASRSKLTKEEKDSAQTDVEDKKNTEEETESDGYQHTAPSTSATSLSVVEAVPYNSTNAVITDDALRSKMSVSVSATDNLGNASEYYRKQIINHLFKNHNIWESFHRRTWNSLYSFIQWQKRSLRWNPTPAGTLWSQLWTLKLLFKIISSTHSYRICVIMELAD